MEVKYLIRYLEEVVRQHIPALPISAKMLIKRAIEERLAVDPIGFGKPLRYSLKGHRRLRVSDYRIIYRIEPSSKTSSNRVNTVLIIAIRHRKDVYDSD